MSRALADAVAIVTGSTRGIGRATAQALAREGAHVVVNGTNQDLATKVVEQLPSDGLAVAGDITAPELPGRLVAGAMQAWGRVDILVNNAGFNWDAPAREFTDEQLRAMLEVHVEAPLRVLRAAAPYLLAGQPREGALPQRKVVNVSSISATMGGAGILAYSAAKAAMIGATKALAKEWGPAGVNVNAIAPGFIATRLTSDTGDSGAIDYHGSRIVLGISSEHRQEMASRVALGRPGTPEDVAGAIAFLCSPASDYVHGQVLTVSGGITLGMEA
jgi:3-oxoacyl-[acyl-carrier protein] reductase